MTQEKIFERLAESSKLIETDGKVFEEMVSKDEKRGATVRQPIFPKVPLSIGSQLNSSSSLRGSFIPLFRQQKTFSERQS